MASDLPEQSLVDLCSAVVDCPHSTPIWTESGFIVLRNQDIKGGRLDLSSPSFTDETHYLARIKRAAPTAGDIVITREAPMGDVCLIPDGLRCCLGQRQVLLRPNAKRVVGRYLLFALQSDYVQHQIGWNEGTGSTVSNLRIPVLERLKIPAPSLPEQHAIAHILGTLDDKIELNRRSNETLEAMAQALFKDWFVDFGPVRAKLEGREPYLTPELWSLFPNALDNGTPAGWRLSHIGDEVAVVGGSTPSTKESMFWDGGTNRWATPKDLSRLTTPVLLDTERKITDAAVARISSGLLPIGTVLLSSRAPIGYLAIAEVPTAINQGFIAMICDRGVPNLYVLHWCRESMSSILGNANGSTFQEISKSNFRPIPVVVPPKPVMDAFMTTASPLYQRIVSNTRENESLATLRDTLLPKLLSGELRVRDAERQVETVL